ncbi:MAG: trypsin-like serine protease [Deltaproteobacteria bacterium]|nr:MAG: trypsin-like serine protease [Deltaproteobacteria bacterium]
MSRARGRRGADAGAGADAGTGVVRLLEPLLRTLIRRVLFILVHSALLAGSVAIAHADEVGSRREHIVNGEPTGEGEALGTVAVALLSEERARQGFEPESLFSGAWCTGVLIAPTVVLTAGHCVEQCSWDTCTDADGEPFDCYGCDPDSIPAARVYISAGSRTLDDMWSAEVVPVRELFVPEGYIPSAYWYLDVGLCQPSGFEEHPRCEKPGLTPDLHDIAVLLLDAPVTSLSPVRILPKIDTLVGTQALAIGYGDRVSPESDELLSQDRYASILNQTSTLVEQVTEQEILTAEGENQSGVCFGDSGGPLYVQRGHEVFIAGVASRFRNDRDGPQCGAGAIYTSASAYADWIFEKAPAANRLTLSGGGGCSATNATTSETGACFVGLLVWVVALRARRKAMWAAPFAFVAIALLGCGPSTNDDVSFCNDTRDPYGIFCNPDTERIDLRAAETIARSEVPGDALLLSAQSSNNGLVDPDGRADSWYFSYYLAGRTEPPAVEFWSISVYSNEQTFVDTFVSDTAGSGLVCIPTAPIPVLDSRQLTHEAIRLMEREGVTVRLADAGRLFIRHNHICQNGEALRNYISYGGMVVYFDDAGTVFKLEHDPPGF